MNYFRRKCFHSSARLFIKHGNVFNIEKSNMFLTDKIHSRFVYPLASGLICHSRTDESRSFSLNVTEKLDEKNKHSSNRVSRILPSNNCHDFHLGISCVKNASPASTTPYSNNRNALDENKTSWVSNLAKLINQNENNPTLFHTFSKNYFLSPSFPPTSSFPILENLNTNSIASISTKSFIQTYNSISRIRLSSEFTILSKRSPITLIRTYSSESNKSKSPFEASGWTFQELTSFPNLISLTRLVSGPYLAFLIFNDNLNAAFVGLVLAGLSDWLDGYVARRQKIDSILGSYLDPLADKVLIGCVCVAMLSKNLLPLWLIVLMILRDATLFLGAFLFRSYSLNWKWDGFSKFFQISDGGVKKMKPSFISKVNTVLQLILVSYVLIKPSLIHFYDFDLIPILSYSVASTTIASWGGYILVAIKKNKILM